MNKPIHAALLALASLGYTSSASAIDLGSASVLSMQGQRLKLAVPYGSSPGQKVPVLRFSVDSVEAPSGFTAPSAGTFVISQPEYRNVVFLQSRERINAPTLKLVLNVVDSDLQKVAYDISVPSMSYAQSQLSETSSVRKPVIKRLVKRKSAAKSRSNPSMSAKAAGLLATSTKNCACETR